MKAIVCTAYGPPEVLQLQEVDKQGHKKGNVVICDDIPFDSSSAP